jgi:regulator of replication initiation timing
LLKNRNINNRIMALRNAKNFLTEKVKAGVDSQTAELKSQFEKVEAKVVTLLDELVNVKSAHKSLLETNWQLNEELDSVREELEEAKKQYKVLAETIASTRKEVTGGLIAAHEEGRVFAGGKIVLSKEEISEVEKVTKDNPLTHPSFEEAKKIYSNNKKNPK